MQPVKLELLAPAKNKDIGIAAIDCGADAVYIAGPSFGARAAAGNPIADIALLADYAHKFSAKIYAAVNTIIFEDELQAAQKMIWELYDAGVDALIVQDLGITRMDLPPIELHASTQCAIRTPEQARMLESLGFSRLILERQLSLEQIRAIRSAVNCELEFFVHGAICVCYSGNCYLSQYLTGRSANRGACIQACRSLYDVVDSEGNILARNRNILSAKDYRLDNRLQELADAGICSFKIEGRLKGDSYVKNLTRHYREKIDNICSSNARYRAASDGSLEGGFTPNPDATFNRGYTELYIDGKRSKWNSLEGSKSLGEFIGTIKQIKAKSILLDTDKTLANGDGLVFICPEGENVGMRVEVAQGREILLKETAKLFPGQKVYRNFNIKFEKQLQSNMPRRKIDVDVRVEGETAVARDSSGYELSLPLPADAPLAEKQQAAVENIARQLSKRTDHFDFHCSSVEQSPAKFYNAAALNALRRQLASGLEELRAEDIKFRRASTLQAVPLKQAAGRADYLANSANSLSRETLLSLGFDAVDDAYEISPKKDAALMRSRYCIKYELGLCPKLHPARKIEGPLFLLNSGRRLRLEFDCKRCEMVISL